MTVIRYAVIMPNQLAKVKGSKINSNCSSSDNDFEMNINEFKAESSAPREVFAIILQSKAHFWRYELLAQYSDEQFSAVREDKIMSMDQGCGFRGLFGKVCVSWESTLSFRPGLPGYV